MQLNSDAGSYQGSEAISQNQQLGKISVPQERELIKNKLAQVLFLLPSIKLSLNLLCFNNFEKLDFKIQEELKALLTKFSDCLSELLISDKSNKVKIIWEDLNNQFEAAVPSERIFPGDACQEVVKNIESALNFSAKYILSEESYERPGQSASANPF